MNKYRKKPLEVEAVRFPDDGPGQIEVSTWVKENGGNLRLFDRNVEHPVETSTGAKWRWKSGMINTLEGNHMIVSIGDYIIKGIKGEFYPCKPDIFEATYEAA